MTARKKPPVEVGPIESDVPEAAPTKRGPKSGVVPCACYTGRGPKVCDKHAAQRERANARKAALKALRPIR